MAITKRMWALVATGFVALMVIAGCYGVPAEVQNPSGGENPKVQDCRQVPPGYRLGDWVGVPGSLTNGEFSYESEYSCEHDLNRLEEL